MTPRCPSHASAQGRSTQDGFILIAALWMLAALAALVVIVSQQLGSSARLLRLEDEAVEAEALISAATELSAYRLLLSKEEDRPKQGAFRLTLAGNDIAVSYVSEAARIDLNAASKEMLENLFVAVGAERDAAKEHAERVVAWRSKPADAAKAQAEEARYASAGLQRMPRLAPFAHVGELALVLDLPAALIDRVLPLVTIFNGSPGIDPSIAPTEVVAALPGMTPLILKDFVNSRGSSSQDADSLAKMLGPAAKDAAKGKSKAVRLHIVVGPAGGLHHAATVVIIPGEGEQPYRLLARQDEGPQPRSARQARSTR
ncbi:Putative General secretion pathway protein K, GspK [Bradyrhizobium sp. ORS 285]|uniref:type II secretion system protein GspK n=1 Tax=Bradyrhizobium sp. ORS 285 TaxID=115808 RepID=UPI00024073D0|nr:type II secretion system protein GspK [Bradyrhizobium sp. ORS 285]CCD89629.1 putative General secretion pathway protein K, GspK [Bradyrhizobium sp. ORS 285]SMX56308.1 Putative General secretion pathway protein K, GspK [Bradyrhizobium sp. ORS 285]